MILRRIPKKDNSSENKDKDKNIFQENDKYIAYSRKVLNRKNKARNEVQPCVIPANNEDNSLINRTKKKNNTKAYIEDMKNESKISKSAMAPKKAVSICAKAKINKSIIKLNADINNKCKTKKNLIKVKKKQQIKEYVKQEGLDLLNMKVITPLVSLVPPLLNEEPRTSSSQFSITYPEFLANDNSNTDDSPIIIKANLKKSSHSYIPKVLQSPKEIKKESTKECEIVENNVQKTNKGLTKASECVSNVNELLTNSSNSTECPHETIRDIPKALQDFYNEVTEELESVPEKLSQTNKNTNKLSPLTVDKSVKDCNNLMDIVKKNTAFLDNLSSLNHENMIHFYSLENKVIAILCPQSQFTFLGKLKLKLLYGAVELYGSVFNSQNTVKPVEMYSPRGCSSINISVFELPGTYDKEALWDALTIEGVDRSLNTKLHKTVNECKYGWSVLLLQNFENTLTNFLNNYYSYRLFPKVDNLKYSWCDPRRAEYILQANFQFYYSKNEILIYPQWNKAITKRLLNQWNSTKLLRTMIVGGKDVGKSTTTRYLINNLLRYSKKVILLDLDPGQSEMTPAGCLSLNILDEPLLGPNFTHLRTPFYQLYLEDISANNCITRYIQCIKMLVERLNNSEDLTQYPVIINTMGFCTGIGLDICIFLIKLIQPTSIIQIQSSRQKNNFSFALMKERINECKTSSISWDNDNNILDVICDYEFHCVPSMAEGKRPFESWNMEPWKKRELALLSYFSQIIKNADIKCFYNLSLNSINNIIPYKLPFSAFYVSLLKSSIAPTHILAAMNGNIVALCGMDLDDDTSAEDKSSLNYPMVVIKPPPCTCYGYGIVRGIDMKQRCIYINTPLLESELRHVNLIAGCSAMPFALLHSGERASAPYAGDRGELPTSREARRGYHRMDQSRNSNRFKRP